MCVVDQCEKSFNFHVKVFISWSFLHPSNLIVITYMFGWLVCDKATVLTIKVFLLSYLGKIVVKFLKNEWPDT